MQQIANLKTRLSLVQIFDFQAYTTLGRQGWEGKGHGQVSIAVPNNDTIIFEEVGKFAPQAGKEIKCHNIYRWTFGATNVKLEHLRFGTNNPVYLFDMVQNNENEWISACPHACDKDFYEARLILHEHFISFSWRIHGEKNETINYQYF